LVWAQREVKAEMGSGAPMAVSMRIGAIESVLHSWLIPWIEKLRADHPALELELTVETTPILVEQVQRGTHWTWCSPRCPRRPMACAAGRCRPWRWCSWVNAQLHRKRRYTLAELGEQEILTFQRGSLPHVALVDLFRQAAVEPKRVHTISSISAMVQLVQGGFGVATLPRRASMI
jgi:DNA-binding transcriptional LysR family regulator